MSLVFERRVSDSPFVDTVTRGRTASDGSAVRPAECRWHMVVVRVKGATRLLVVGPWTAAGVASWGEGAELLWIRFKLGTFMPHLPPKTFLNTETVLPGAASHSFWLHSAAWQYPDYENVETFIDRLARDHVLACDPTVNEALQGHSQAMAPRTVRHRFLRATGLAQSHIHQVERAQQAAALLEQGVPILDVVYQLGYFDQPHLTRSLKRWVGNTPAQLLRLSRPDCQSVQDIVLSPEYDTEALLEAR